MKFYTYVLAFAVGSPQVWGSDAARVTYHVETVAGSSLMGDGGPALSAQFSAIQGIAIDRLGNLYLSETLNHRVRKVTGGIVTTIVGTGVAGFSGDGKAAVDAQLNLPYGLALDSAGNLYVADFGNERVRKIAPDGTITTIAGTGQKASSPDGPPLSTSLLSPRNVAVDTAGNLYIAEYEGHRVRRLTPGGMTLTTVAGTGEAAFFGDGGLATLAQLKYPAGMAFDRAGALYIADSGNNVVRKIVAGGVIVTVMGQPPGTMLGVPPGPLLGKNPASLYTPIALALDVAGTIYEGDVGSHTVGAYTPVGKWITYVGGGGTLCAPASAACAMLKFVNDLAGDGNGNLWIADGVRVWKVDSAGTIQLVAGDGYQHALGDGGPAMAANLYQPSGVTLDGVGNLFIADTGTERVRQVAPGGTITTLAGTGVPAAGQVGGAAANAALSGPAGVTIDAAGNVIIADTVNDRIVAVNAAHLLLAVAGTGTQGESPAGAPPLFAALVGPQAVCTDLGGNLYIADTFNHRVLKLPPGGVLQTAAGNGSAGYAGDGGVARLAQLNAPGACATDSASTLYIADTANNAIRKVTAAGMISTVAGTGGAGSAGDEGAATSAQLAAPRGVAVDDAGDIFIGDSGNNRIRMVTPDGLIHVIAGTSSAGFAGDSGPANAAQLNGPQGLFLDGAGNLYFADTNNNRIRRLVPDAPAPAPVVMPVSTVTVVNALSLLAGSVAPGEVVSIFGLGLGPDLGVTGTLDASGMLPGILAGVEVQFNGSDAPIFYAVSGQINAQVPYVVAGSDASTVAVIYQGKVVGTATVGVAPSAPGLLTVATNQDGTVNAQAAPAARGGWMTFFATGEGLTDSGDVAGVPAQAPYPHPLLAISLTIAGMNADILYAGSAPGLIGVLQINARVPGGFVPPGPAEVALTVGTVTAPAVTVWLK
jgi:uncharacterized protein (TIGR03437 family)